MKNPEPERYENTGFALFQKGFEPLPVEGKQPCVSDWTTIAVDEDQVRHWAGNGFAGQSVGIRCGKVHGIDIDVRDKSASRLLAQWMDNNFNSGKKLPRRFGQHPKFLTPCIILDLDGKVSSPAYYDQRGQKHQIEILAAGQQFVAYGTHPDTQKPYTWQNGSLLDIGSQGLRQLASSHISNLFDRFGEIAKERGWSLEAEPKKNDDSQQFTNCKTPGLTADELRQAAFLLPQKYAHDYSLWTKTGFALHFETSGSDDGMSLYNDFSKRSDKYRSLEEIKRKWQSFRDDKSGDNTITGATLFKWLKDEGIKLPIDNPEKPAEDISIPEWPILDSKALYGFPGRFVEFAVKDSEADPVAVLITFLVRFGVEVPKPTMWVGDTRHKANISSVVVGASSKARKGTSGKPVMRLFEPLTFESDEIHNNRAKITPGPFSSGEGIIHAVRDPVMGVDKKTGEPIEVDPGVKDKRLFVLDEEFAGVMAQTKREGNILSMIIRTVWDTGNLDPLTKTTKIRATGAHIGWVSHITLYELITRLSETEMFNGYANRILWVCARRSKLVAWPPPMDMETLSQFQYELSEIIEAHQGIVEVVPDNEVRKAWEDKYYRELTEERPGLVGCVVNRAEAQVMRLALIYCLLDKCHIIRIEHLEAALALWNYCEASANYIFDGRQQDNISQNILDSLQDGAMSGTDIHRLFNSHVSSERLKIALSELEAAGKIGIEKQPTKGRPVTTYFLKDIGIKSVISVKTSDHSDKKPLNTLFTLNTQGNSENDPQEYEEII